MEGAGGDEEGAPAAAAAAAAAPKSSPPPLLGGRRRPGKRPGQRPGTGVPPLITVDLNHRSCGGRTVRADGGLHQDRGSGWAGKGPPRSPSPSPSKPPSKPPPPAAPPLAAPPILPPAPYDLAGAIDGLLHRGIHPGRRLPTLRAAAELFGHHDVAGHDDEVGAGAVQALVLRAGYALGGIRPGGRDGGRRRRRRRRRRGGAGVSSSSSLLLWTEIGMAASALADVHGCSRGVRWELYDSGGGREEVAPLAGNVLRAALLGQQQQQQQQQQQREEEEEEADDDGGGG